MAIDLNDLPETPPIPGVPRGTPEDAAEIEEYLDALTLHRLEDDRDILDMEGRIAYPESAPGNRRRNTKAAEDSE